MLFLSSQAKQLLLHENHKHNLMEISNLCGNRTVFYKTHSPLYAAFIKCIGIVFQLADNLMLFHGLVSNKLFDNMQISRFIIFFCPLQRTYNLREKIFFWDTKTSRD